LLPHGAKNSELAQAVGGERRVEWTWPEAKADTQPDHLRPYTTNPHQSAHLLSLYGTPLPQTHNYYYRLSPQSIAVTYHI